MELSKDRDKKVCSILFTSYRLLIECLMERLHFLFCLHWEQVRVVLFKLHVAPVPLGVELDTRDRPEYSRDAGSHSPR